jgi:hypothetical protein
MAPKFRFGWRDWRRSRRWVNERRKEGEGGEEAEEEKGG